MTNLQLPLSKRAMVPGDVLVRAIFGISADSDDKYTCNGPHMGGEFHTIRLYGGQAVCQAFRAIQEKVGLHFQPSTLHYRFIAPGKPDVPIQYEINVVGDKTFTVKSSQSGKLIGSAFCSGNDELLEGNDYELGYVPEPDDVTLLPDVVKQCGASKYAPADWPIVDRNVFDIGVVEWGKYSTCGTPKNLIWIRVQENYRKHVPKWCGLQMAILFSDYFIIQIAQDIGNSNGFALPVAASLSHSIRFHMRNEEIDPHQWFLFRVECRAITMERTLLIANVYDSKKRAVLSIVQEAYTPFEKRKSSKL